MFQAKPKLNWSAQKPITYITNIGRKLTNIGRKLMLWAEYTTAIIQTGC